jgi:transcriptional regulator with XRE-family HTH domain
MPEAQERLVDLRRTVSESRMRAMAEPVAVHYLDYRAFLRDWFAARAGRPSLRAFAARAGCSPSLVSSVLAGKRDLHTGRAEAWAKALKLDATETWYLITLVVMAHDASPERRRRAMAEALMMQQTHGGIVHDDDDTGFGESAPREETHTVWVSALALPSDRVPELRARVARFWEETQRWAAASQGEGDSSVCQLSMQVFPSIAGTLVGESKRKR